MILLLLACKSSDLVDSESPSPAISTREIQASQMTLYDVAFTTSSGVAVSCPYCLDAQVYIFDPANPPATLRDAPLKLFAGSEFTDVGLRLPQGATSDTLWIGAVDASSGIGIGHVTVVSQFSAGTFSIPQSATAYSDDKPRGAFGMGAAWIEGQWHTSSPRRGAVPPTLYNIPATTPYIFGPIDACSVQVFNSCAIDQVFVGEAFWYTANGGLVFRYEPFDPVASAFKLTNGAVSYISTSSAIEDDQIVTRMAVGHDGVVFLGSWHAINGYAEGGVEFRSTPVGGSWSRAYSRDFGESDIGDYVIYGTQDTQTDGSVGGYRIELQSGDYAGEIFDLRVSDDIYYCPAPVVKTDGGSSFAVLCELTGSALLVGRVE